MPPSVFDPSLNQMIEQNMRIGNMPNEKYKFKFTFAGPPSPVDEEDETIPCDRRIVGWIRKLTANVSRNVAGDTFFR